MKIISVTQSAIIRLSLLRTLTGLVGLVFAAMPFCSAQSQQSELISAAGRPSSQSSGGAHTVSGVLDKLKPLPLPDDPSLDRSGKAAAAASGSVSSVIPKGKSQKKRITVFEDEEPTGIREPQGTTPLAVIIDVPRNHKAVTSVRLLPWPPKPPLEVSIDPLPDDEETIEKMLIDSGYLNRPSDEEFMPANGWRWHYAFKNACKLSGMDKPKSIFRHYGWAKRVMKHVKPEIDKFNAFEEQRIKKYHEYVEFYTDNSSVIEHEAVRAGLEPVELKRIPYRGHGYRVVYTGRVPATRLWIDATHKIAGLQYYWQMRIDPEAGKPTSVKLTEGNALMIEGGW